MEHPWFKDWFNSPYYHLLYFNRDEQEAAAFIDRLIKDLHPAKGATTVRFPRTIPRPRQPDELPAGRRNSLKYRENPSLASFRK